MIKERNGSYQADFVIKGKRIRRQFPSAGAAEEFEKIAQAKAVLSPTTLDAFVSPNKSEDAPPQKLSELFERCQEIHWDRQKSAATAEYNAATVLKLLGDPPINLITAATIDRLVLEQLKLQREPSTINRKLSCLQKALNFAKDRGWITAIPKFNRLPEPKGRIRIYTSAEERDLQDAFKFFGFADMSDLLTVLLDTGMRLGEALKITAADLDLDRRNIRIWINKADQPRSVPMTQRVWAIFKSRTSFPFNSNQVEHIWSRVRSHLGKDSDPGWILHTCRHTCASRLIDKGEDLLTVKEWLGHKTIQTTLRYAHLAPDKLKNAAAKLESYGSTGYSLPSVTQSQDVTQVTAA